MSEIAIRVEKLSKRYQIGVAQQRHDTLRDALGANLARLRPTRHGPRAARHAEEFWALQDVSFEVKRGEVVGIIGRNGAGKSTLLKILSRITEPTSGQAQIHGRVGSLLEVGTGFHPELTGRENIYLNGAILGMRRFEIERKFDEIVAFAEIEKFLDTPVKRYSSGMYVRLAFAVAAHLEPEILLVDEVLAVGDAAFQKKCLGKMGDVAREGRTVLFVSHNMAAVQSLCNTSVLLSDGSIAARGLTEDVTRIYLAAGVQTGEAQFNGSTPRQGNGVAQYTRAKMLDEDGNLTSSVPMGGSLTLELQFENRQPVAHPAISARLHTPLGQDIAAWRSQETLGQMPSARVGGSVRLQIRELNLLPGRYHFALGLTDGYQTLDFIEDALSIEVTPKVMFDSESFSSFRRGELIYTPCEWLLNYE
jgi:lipopolysaccharide transport system ATP-binding protein